MKLKKYLKFRIYPNKLGLLLKRRLISLFFLAVGPLQTEEAGTLGFARVGFCS